MQSREPVAERKKPGQIFSNDVPFEIFTPDEIKSIADSIQDKHLLDAADYIIPRINQGMHNKKIGWFKQLESQFSEEKDFLAQAEIYLTAARRLQAPESGRCMFWEEKSRVVDVNKGFWDDCVGAVPSSLAVVLAKQYLADRPPHENARIDIYTLFRIKQNFLSRLEESERNKISANINTSLKLIYRTVKIPECFILSKEEVKAAHDVRDDLKNKMMNVSLLRLLLESTPEVIRYIHLRPYILVHFAQALDYLYDHINYSHKLSVGLVKTAISGVSVHPALVILDKKRQEIAAVMSFQEMLLDRYGSSDFIECLQLAIGNVSKNEFVKLSQSKSTVQDFKQNALQSMQDLFSLACFKAVPTGSFFKMEKRAKIQVIKFDSADPDKPKWIELDELSTFRKKYIALHSTKKMEAKKEEKPQSVEVKSEDKVMSEEDVKKIVINEAIKTSRLFAVSNQLARVVRVPIKIADKLQQIQDKTFDISGNSLFDFFVDQYQVRKRFYENMNRYFNQFKRSVDVLSEQVKKQVSHYVLFEPLLKPRLSLFNARKARDLTNAAKINFSEFTAAIAIFDDADNEIENAKSAMQKATDGQETFAFLEYINSIVKLQAEFFLQMQTILDYWTGYVQNVDFTQHERPEVESLSDIISGIDGLVRYDKTSRYA